MSLEYTVSIGNLLSLGGSVIVFLIGMWRLSARLAVLEFQVKIMWEREENAVRADHTDG